MGRKKKKKKKEKGRKEKKKEKRKKKKKRRRREEKNIVREIMLVVGVLRVRTRMAKMRKNKMKGVVLMCLVVVTIEGERWVIVCLVDRVGLRYIRVILVEGLGGERRVAI